MPRDCGKGLAHPFGGVRWSRVYVPRGARDPPAPRPAIPALLGGGIRGASARGAVGGHAAPARASKGVARGPPRPAAAGPPPGAAGLPAASPLRPARTTRAAAGKPRAVSVASAASAAGGSPRPGRHARTGRRGRGREGPGARRGHPGGEAARGGTAGGASRGAAAPRTLRRLRGGRLAALPRPGDGGLQGPVLAGPRRGAADARHRGRVRERQADGLQRLLHVARRRAGHVRGVRAPRACPKTRPCWSPGAARGTSSSSHPRGMHFIGVELDSLSGRIARALYPGARHPHRELPRHAAPEAWRRRRHRQRPVRRREARAQRRSGSRSTTTSSPSRSTPCRPGGVLALVTTHFTLDKQNGGGARVPRRRGPTSSGRFACRPTPSSGKGRRSSPTSCSCGSGPRARRRATRTPSWLEVAPLAIEGADVPINRYFHDHPEMVLGQLEPQGPALRGRAGLQRRRSTAILEEQAPGGRRHGCRSLRTRPAGDRARRECGRPSPRRRSSGTSPRAASSSATTGDHLPGRRRPGRARRLRRDQAQGQRHA